MTCLGMMKPLEGKRLDPDYLANQMTGLKEMGVFLSVLQKCKNAWVGNKA